MKTLKLTLLSLFFLLGMGNQTQAQPFLKGAIITLNQDTIPGFVKSYGPIQRCKKVEFKRTPGAEVENYTPDQLHGYKIASDSYQSLKVVLAGEDFERSVFSKYLVTGAISLLRLDFEAKDDFDPLIDYKTLYYFAVKANSSENRLLLDGTATLSMKEWLGPCSYVDERKTTGRYRYRDSDMAEMIEDYNRCLGSPSVKLSKASEEGRKFSVGASYSYLIPSMEIPHSAYSDYSDPTKSGIGIDLWLGFTLTQYLELRFGVGYRNRQNQFKRSETVSSDYLNEGELLELQADQFYKHVQLNLSGVFFILKDKKVNPYIVAGGNYGFGLKTENMVDRSEFMNDLDLGGNFLVVKMINPYDVSDMGVDIGFHTGIGAKWPFSEKLALILELNYAQSQNDFNDNLKIRNKEIGIKIGLVY